MQFCLKFTDEAQENYDELVANSAKKNILKQVRKALGLMQTNLKHPSLQTHKYSSLTGKNNEDVFESYAQNKTSGAYRIFWHYGPYELEKNPKKGKKPKVLKHCLTIIAITPHP